MFLIKTIILLIIINFFLIRNTYATTLNGNATPSVPEEKTTTSEETQNVPQTGETQAKTSEEEAIIDTKALATEQKEAEPKTEYKGSDYRTLIFTEEELLKLISILGSGKIKAETTELGTSQTIGEQKVTTTIYLNSIMYLSPDSWAIWVNEKKIANYEKDSGDLRVLNITSDRVKFLWTVSRTKWDIMMPNFDFMNSISKINENNEVETIFTLSPNQSFLPETGEVVEGKVKIERRMATEETTGTETGLEGQTGEQTGAQTGEQTGEQTAQ